MRFRDAAPFRQSRTEGESNRRGVEQKQVHEQEAANRRGMEQEPIRDRKGFATLRQNMMGFAMLRWNRGGCNRS